MVVLPLSLVLLCWPLSLAWAQSSTSAPASSSGSFSVSGSAVSASQSASASQAVSSNASSSATPTSSANFPSLSGYSSCVVNCLGLSISQVGCSSIVDVDCYCPNATQFSRQITGCVSGTCSEDLASAEQVAQLFCNVASTSVSLSFPPLPSSLSTSLSQSSTQPPSSASQTSASLTSASPSASQGSGAGPSCMHASAFSIAVTTGAILALMGSLL